MLDENYQVSKSKELLILSDLHLAIGELKIFDTYLSKIDPESLGKIEKSYEGKLEQANTRQEVEKVLKEMKQDLEKCDMCIESCDKVKDGRMVLGYDICYSFVDKDGFRK